MARVFRRFVGALREREGEEGTLIEPLSPGPGLFRQASSWAYSPTYVVAFLYSPGESGWRGNVQFAPLVYRLTGGIEGSR